MHIYPHLFELSWIGRRIFKINKAQSALNYIIYFIVVKSEFNIADIQEKRRYTNGLMRRTMYVRFWILCTFLSCPQQNKDQANDQILRCLENVNHEGEFFKFLFRIYCVLDSVSPVIALTMTTEQTEWVKDTAGFVGKILTYFLVDIVIGFLSSLYWGQ